LNVPSASCIAFSLSTLMASVAASSARSVMAGAKKSRPDGEERDEPSCERAREEREPVEMRRRGCGRCAGGI
jgi:ribosomal protein L12E/L44/L45/RPP1/RPP2